MPRTPKRPDPAAPAGAGPVSDLSSLPLVMKIEDVARVYNRGVSTIKRELRDGTFNGAHPFDTGKPLRWLREHVEADLKRRARQKPPTRRRTRRAAAATM